MQAEEHVVALDEFQDGGGLDEVLTDGIRRRSSQLRGLQFFQPLLGFVHHEQNRAREEAIDEQEGGDARSVGES